MFIRKDQDNDFQETKTSGKEERGTSVTLGIKTAENYAQYTTRFEELKSQLRSKQFYRFHGYIWYNNFTCFDILVW